jgi:hypothetical protein
LYDCWSELKNDEKWRNRDGLKVPLKLRKAIKKTVDGVIGLEVSSSSEETPNSIAKTTRGRSIGMKQAKLGKSKSGDDDFDKAMSAMVQARKDAVEERKLSREKDADVERRRVVAEERRATADERRLALEEKRDATEENQRLIEQEKNFFLMDTSNLDDMGGNVGMGAMGGPPGGFMSMVSPMPSMPTPNDGFIPSPPIHSTNAHTTKVQNEDEEQDGGAKEDGDDE